MRDIRNDLAERLSETLREREVLEKRLTKLAQKEEMQRALLEDEEARMSRQQPLPGLELGIKTHSPLGRFIVETLNTGQPWKLQDLLNVAETKGIAVTRRALHFALVGMKQNGLVEMPASGVWKLKQR